MLKYSIRFKLQYSKDKTASKPRTLRCIINYNNMECDFNSGLKIEPQYWNQKKQEPRQNVLFAEYTKFKTDLKNIGDWASISFNHIADKINDYPDVAALKDLCETLVKTNGEIPGEKKEAASSDLIQYITQLIYDTKSGKRTKKDGKIFAPNSYKSHNTTKGALEKYIKYAKLKSIKFESIDLGFYSDFKDWCYNVEIFADNYFGTHIKNIKTFMNEAMDAGLHTNIAHRHKKFITIKTDVDNIYLDEAKLKIIAEFDFSKDKKLERVRDMFLVGCWTGLRFSDFSNIQAKDIKGDFIEIKTKKTGETVAIPIHPVILSIMERYKGSTHNSLPPSISNVKFNEYIKDAAEKTEQLSDPISLEKSIAGKRVIVTHPLYELISTHTARRSFATNMFKMGIPTIVIKGVTGHRSDKAFMSYIKVTPREKAEMMREIWNRDTMKAVK